MSPSPKSSRWPNLVKAVVLLGLFLGLAVAQPSARGAAVMRSNGRARATTLRRN